MRRGFTLIELAFVLAIIATLTAVTVPITFTLLQRARAEEARTTIHAIANAELQHFRDHGEYLPCAASGDVPRAPVAFSPSECWTQLGITRDGLVRYRYSVVADKDTFTVIAEGDLDADGTASRISLDGKTLEVMTERELE